MTIAFIRSYVDRILIFYRNTYPVPRILNPPSEGSVLKICHVTGCSFDWLMYGKGDMGLETSTTPPQPSGQTIDLSHEKESFTFSEMVSMTTHILESDTVYAAAMASNVRALYKAVITEGEMKNVQNEMAELRADIKELRELVLSLGAKLPEKREKAANS